jgi:flagellar biosynthetic protein FlhB
MSNEKLKIINNDLTEVNARDSFPLPTPYIIPLQWFADDNEEDAPGKTEDPTEYRLKKLREEGQVPKSQELVGALGLLLPALLLLFLSSSMLRNCVDMIRFFFYRAIELDPTKDAIIFRVFLRYFITLALPLLAVAMIAGIFSNILQTNGVMFTTKPLVPNFTKVIPKIGQFFKRIFSVDGLYNALKSIAKMVIIGFVAFLLIRLDFNKILNLQKAGIWLGFTTIASIAIRLLLFISVLLVILSIPDIIFQRWRFKERNKMARWEIKEELKMHEADPQIQHRIRRRFRELVSQNISALVPRADVVITNPTHLAIALQYDPLGPKVIAMGADELSARIRKIAEDHEVPLVENKPLAWALYGETNVGDTVPYTYWKTIALIMSKVWYLNEERRKRLSA